MYDTEALAASSHYTTVYIRPNNTACTQSRRNTNWY